ncbi:response regulator receiver domain-containing protein [Prosthecobacter fusiformis]|uniref:Response regulator receiver domain-containing protein n=1 Tax=Prosthecobacter fusiformis TaxID=48464 RepID=A0A4R7RVM0_9BACT|nr:response regulator [Prosthecobacter fusiformis]TDU69309.1 response regulator receiver domain-containing protein [Prosthecobacter fusiformis]
MTEIINPSFLVVEDSDEDYAALERILKRAKADVPIRLQRCTSAEQVLDMLKAPVLPNRPLPPLPAVIVLDLNLPGVNGKSVLLAVRQHPRLKRTPVVIFSTSSSPQDIAWCYEHGANSYHVKQTDYSAFKRAVELLVDYWVEAVRLPLPPAPECLLEKPDEADPRL